MVRSHIGWGGERNNLYKRVEPLSTRRVLKILRESSEGKVQSEQYLLGVFLGRYNNTTRPGQG